MTMRLAATYPVSVVCAVLGYRRSSYYYRPQPPDDTALKTAIQEVAGAWPRYGYRRITAQIRGEKQWVVNHKRVRRVMSLVGIQGQCSRRKRRTTNSEHSFARYPNLFSTNSGACCSASWNQLCWRFHSNPSSFIHVQMVESDQ